MTDQAWVPKKERPSSAKLDRSWTTLGDVVLRALFVHLAEILLARADQGL